MCTFEEHDACLFHDDLNLKERWIVVKTTVRKWDNTLNTGIYLRSNLNAADWLTTQSRDYCIYK